MQEVMNHIDGITVGVLFISVFVIEALQGRYSDGSRPKEDWIIDIVSVLQLVTWIKPLIFISSAALLFLLLPDYANSLADMPFGWALLLVFLPDDFMHYWYHRLAHNNAFVWPWHRTHHTPQQYQVTIAFRENWLWFLLMPGLWWGGIMIYLGLGKEVIVSTLIIGVHNIYIHTSFAKERLLYQHPLLSKVMTAMEYIIQTPSLHRAHHGVGEYSAPMGNFGQTLFIWDVLFNTAYFPREHRPAQYGLTDNPNNAGSWPQQLWWPLFADRS